MSKVELKIDWATHEAAKYACENWHYSKCLPVGKLVKIGAWENGKFIGVVLFGRGANNNMLKPYNLQQDQGCELVRIALTKHVTPVSKIMSIALKMLSKAQPRLRLVVSYADQDQNHAGGIYKAANWIYTGSVYENGLMFIIHGKKTHTKSVHSKGVRANIDHVRKFLDPNAEVFRAKGKHRYLMPLDPEMKNRILPLAKPYPKRATSIDSDAANIQLAEGGATPTVALNTKESEHG